jgi:hypothetical protein
VVSRLDRSLRHSNAVSSRTLGIGVRLGGFAERGVLQSPSRGLGFGVGAEPLAATFASFGCHIIATDLPPDEATKKGWAGGVQYAGKIEGLKKMIESALRSSSEGSLIFAIAI